MTISANVVACSRTVSRDACLLGVCGGFRFMLFNDIYSFNCWFPCELIKYYNISDGFHHDTHRILVPEAEEDLPAIPAWKQGAAEQHPGGAVSPFPTGLWMLLGSSAHGVFSCRPMSWLPGTPAPLNQPLCFHPTLNLSRLSRGRAAEWPRQR